jgi:hypothetical protein
MKNHWDSQWISYEICTFGFRPIHLQSALRSRGEYGKQAALRGVRRLLGMTPRAIEVNGPRFRIQVKCW